ncbi:hypothetical protein GCM10009712_10830 [Pseudarthrobacter sulfonivorans]|uniref:hypothetical protein n=1 Tax=Pseudarthrobacter sulfonivorans TaxID=121292 RepID=UPI00168BCBAE|nr:hypothetical protein [Pseudarthrobacter sulfonivorans]
MEATDDPQPPAGPTPPISSLGIKVGGVVISALAFNWLSDLWSPTAPVVILLAVVSLGLLALSDLSKFENSPILKRIGALKRDGYIELTLAALVLGFVIALIMLIPLFPTTRHMIVLPGDLGDGFGNWSVFWNYEVGALATVVLMVAVAAYRAPSVSRQTVFLTSAVYGTTVAFTYFRPENDFIATLFGSLLVAGIATILLVALPTMFHVLKSFWALDAHGRNKNRKEKVTIPVYRVDRNQNPSGGGKASED